MPTLHAGVASRIITPPPGYKRFQWGGQSLVATGSIRPLWAKALVFESAGVRFAIVSLDVCFINMDCTRNVEAILTRRLPDIRINLILIASHSHQAPVMTGPGDDSYALGYADLISTAIADSIIDAYQSRRPASVHLAQTQTDGLNQNRRRPEQAIDKTLSLLRIDAIDGRPLCFAWHFAAHPLTAMNTRAVWDPDFPGVTNELLEQAYPGVQAQYLQGVAGDVFPLDWHFRLPASRWATSTESTNYLGARLAQTIESLIHADRYSLIDGPVRSVAQSINLPTRTPSFSLAQARAAADYYEKQIDLSTYQQWLPEDHVIHIAQTYETRYRWLCAKFCVRMAQMAGKTLPCHMGVHRVGQLVLATLPGELFSELGFAIRDHRPDARTLVLPYCNDNLIYLPTRRDLDEVQGWSLDEMIEQKHNRWAYGATATTFVGQAAGELIVSTQQFMIDKIMNG